MFRVTRRYRFSASHRLHSVLLSDEQNQQVYGKCDHPYGHGHNYVLEVSAEGPLDPSGRAVDSRLLDGLVARRVLEPFDHRNLNTDIEWPGSVVPTSENLGMEICRRLREDWASVFPGEWPKLATVRIEETPRNIFEIRVDEI